MPFDPSTAKPLEFDPSTASEAPVEQPDANLGMGYAALHGLEDTATFGLGDHVAAGIANLVNGRGYGTNLDEIRQNAAASANANPVSALAGDVAGVVAGGGALKMGGEALARVPGLIGDAASAVGRAITPVNGQTGRNIAKAAATGATFGAADAAGHGGNEDQTMLGAATGAVLGPLAGAAVNGVARVAAPAASRAMALLAQKVGETPAVLQAAYSAFQQATGRVPTMAELIGLRSQGEIRKLAEGNPTIGEALNAARDRIGGERAASLPVQVGRATGPVQDMSTLVSGREAAMTAAMNPIRATMIPLQPADADLLAQPAVRAILREAPELRGRVGGALNALTPSGTNTTPAELSVGDLDAVRQALRERQARYANPAPGNTLHNTAVAGEVGALADRVGQLVSGQVPEYGMALRDYGNASDYINSFEHGLSGKTAGEVADPRLQRALGTPHGQQGYGAGTAARLANAAGSSQRGAVQTAGALAENTGVTRQATEALGPQVTARIQGAAQAESQGAAALDAVTPGAVSPQDSGISAGDALHAGAAIVGGHSPGWIASTISRVIPGWKDKASPQVQALIARYLADPRYTQQGITLLRRAGARDAEIRSLSAAVAASAGAAAGDAAGGN